MLPFIINIGGEEMSHLYLDKADATKLASAISFMENKMGTSDYRFEPVDMMTGCTCEGNCDGVPSGCTWH